MELWDDTNEIITKFLIWQQAQGLSKRTITERIFTVKKFLQFSQKTPRQFDAHDVAKFCSRPGLSSVSVCTYHSELRAFSKWLVRANVRSDDPLLNMTPPKRPKGLPRPLPVKDIQKVLATVNRRRTRIYVYLALYAGLRVHEIAKIRGEDIDLERGVILMRGKGGSMKQIPLHPKLREIAETMPRAGYWFYSYAGSSECVDRRSVSAAIKRAFVRAGVTGQPHQLRHSYGTRLLELNTDMRTVQQLMRHESLNTTALYVAVNWETQRKALDGLEYEQE